MRNYALLMLILPMIVSSQQLAYEFTLDPNEYEELYWLDTNSLLSNAQILLIQVPGKTAFMNEPFGGKDMISTSNTCRFFRKKSSDQLDIFTYSGKVGSVTISPSIVPANNFIYYLVLSQTIIDNDIGWEYIVNFRNDTANKAVYKVIDDNGSVMLSDSGFAFYCYDGQNTYVGVNSSYSTKFWKFRSNINPVSQPLSKSLANSFDPIIALTPQGDLRVTLDPSTTGQTRVQIFDALGRQLYNRKIETPKSKITFTVPTHKIANTPFISRINNGDKSFIQKNIPVR